MKLRTINLQKKEEISEMLESRNYLSLDEKELDKITSRAKLNSIIIIIQPLKDSLRFNNDFSWLEREVICSEVEEAARRHWSNTGMHYHKKVEKMKKALRKEMGKKFDENPTRYIDGIIENITKKEIYPIVRKRLMEKYKVRYGRWWTLRVKEMERKRIAYHWHRRYDHLPYPLNMHWDYRNDWMQIYIASKNGKNFHRSGSSASSGSRQCHDFFGHKFAELNSKKLIPTEIFVYTKYNKFKFYKRFKNLVLISRDLTTTYPLNRPIPEKKLMYCTFSTGFLDKGRFWIKIGKEK